MDYEENEIVFGDVPPGLEVLGALPNRVTQTLKTVGHEVIQAVYGQETTTSFDLYSANDAA